MKADLDNPPVVLLTAQDAAVPAVIAARSVHAGRRFIEFFTANIRNPHTRKAYYRAASGFFDWCEQARLGLLDIEPVHVAAWVESLGRDFSPPSVKQALAAVRMLFDWLVVGQVLAVNPAAAVRGPKYVVRVGKTPVLAAPEARQLLDSINVTTAVGLRDRAGRTFGLHLRPYRRGVDDRGGRLLAAPPPMGPPARERRQGTQHALPP